jgi:MoxR-like ATPase
MYIKINHPDAETEKKILRLVRNEIKDEVQTNNIAVSVDDILLARKEALNVHMSDPIEEYLVQLIVATRNPEKYSTSLKGVISFGASPRATLALDRCSKINAWINGRDFVTPEDVHAVVYDILRHRLILSFEAQAEGITSDYVISSLLKLVPLP